MGRDSLRAGPRLVRGSRGRQSARVSRGCVGRAAVGRGPVRYPGGAGALPGSRLYCTAVWLAQGSQRCSRDCWCTWSSGRSTLTAADGLRRHQGLLGRLEPVRHRLEPARHRPQPVHRRLEGLRRVLSRLHREHTATTRSSRIRGSLSSVVHEDLRVHEDQGQNWGSLRGTWRVQKELGTVQTQPD